MKMERLWYAESACRNFKCAFYSNSPRKWLLDRLCRKSAKKIYIDKVDGSVQHVGWIIAGMWISIYRLEVGIRDTEKQIVGSSPVQVQT